MNTLRICGLFAALALTVSAMAYPTLTGPTGQAVIPTAMTAGSGFTIAADYQNLTGEGDGIPIRALLGIGQNLEIGVLYEIFNDESGLDNAMGANAKFALGNILGGRTAIGAQFIRLETDFDDTLEVIQAYLAWTRRMAIGDEQALALTLGANWTQADFDGDSIDDTRFFAGLDLALSERLNVLIDYQTASSEFEEDPISAVTARIALNRMLALQVGTTNALGPIGLDEHNFFIGLNARFGGGA